jgi:hypothetical protein
MGMGNESAGNLSPAPPQWTKGPGVSAGRSHRLTGACPTVVNNHLRKVDAARRIAPERSSFPAKVPILRMLAKTRRASRCRPKCETCRHSDVRIWRRDRPWKAAQPAKFSRSPGFANRLRS